MNKFSFFFVLCLTYVFIAPVKCYSSSDVALARVSADVVDSSGFRVIARLTNDDYLKLYCLKLGYEGELYEVNTALFNMYSDIDLSSMSVTHGSVLEEDESSNGENAFNITVYTFVKFGLFSYRGEEATRDKSFSLSLAFSAGKLVSATVRVYEKGSTKYIDTTEYEN